MTGQSSRRSPLHSYPFVLLLAAASVGILTDRLWPRSVLCWWMGGCACLLAWLGLSRGATVRGAAWLLLLSAASLFASWHHRQWQLFAVDDRGEYNLATPSLSR